MRAMSTAFALAAFAVPAIVKDSQTDDIEDHMRFAIGATHDGSAIWH